MTESSEDTGEPPVLSDRRLVPLRATRSESVSSLLLVIAHNLHSVNLSFAGMKEVLNEYFECRTSDTWIWRQGDF